MHTIYHIPGVKVGCTICFEHRKTEYPEGTQFELIMDLKNCTDKQAGDIEWFWADFYGYRRGNHYEHAILARNAKTPEERSARAKQREANRTPEERSATAKKRATSRTPEERSASAKKRAAAKTPEERSAQVRKANAGRTPEERSASVAKGHASRTPEERSASGIKARDTRMAFVGPRLPQVGNKKACTVDGITIYKSVQDLIKELGQGKNGSRSKNLRFIELLKHQSAK